jgi:hypothetical protein
VVLEIAGLPMCPTGPHLPLGGALAVEGLRHNDPGHVWAALQQLTEECLRGGLGTPRLDEDLQPIAALIHGAPAGVPRARDREEDLIQVPGVARSGTPELMANILAKRQTPWAQGFRRDDDSSGAPPRFDIARAEAEAAIPPHGMADDLGWETGMLGTVGRWRM